MKYPIGFYPCERCGKSLSLAKSEDGYAHTCTPPSEYWAKVEAELTELRAFKQRVMKLQPVGYFTNDNNDKYKFDDAAIPLYDLTGIKE